MPGSRPPEPTEPCPHRLARVRRVADLATATAAGVGPYTSGRTCRDRGPAGVGQGVRDNAAVGGRAACDGPADVDLGSRRFLKCPFAVDRSSHAQPDCPLASIGCRSPQLSLAKEQGTNAGMLRIGLIVQLPCIPSTISARNCENPVQCPQCTRRLAGNGDRPSEQEAKRRLSFDSLRKQADTP